MALVWTDDRSEKDGRVLEIEPRPDGTFWLKVWLSPSSSKIADIFSSEFVAKYAAENLPTDVSQIREPHAAFGQFR